MVRARHGPQDTASARNLLASVHYQGRLPPKSIALILPVQTQRHRKVAVRKPAQQICRLAQRDSNIPGYTSKACIRQMLHQILKDCRSELGILAGSASVRYGLYGGVRQFLTATPCYHVTMNEYLFF